MDKPDYAIVLEAVEGVVNMFQEMRERAVSLYAEIKPTLVLEDTQQKKKLLQYERLEGTRKMFRVIWTDDLGFEHDEPFFYEGLARNYYVFVNSNRKNTNALLSRVLNTPKTS